MTSPFMTVPEDGSHSSLVTDCSGGVSSLLWTATAPQQS